MYLVKQTVPTCFFFCQNVLPYQGIHTSVPYRLHFAVSARVTNRFRKKISYNNNPVNKSVKIDFCLILVFSIMPCHNCTHLILDIKNICNEKKILHDPKLFEMNIYRYSSQTDCLHNFLLAYKLNIDQFMVLSSFFELIKVGGDERQIINY